MKEIWKDIKGYEGLYQVSDLGRVKSLYKNKIFSGYINNCGYYRVLLCKNGIKKNYSIHRLVYYTFNPDKDRKLDVNHINENKKDNRLQNLNLLTHKENINWGTAIQRQIKTKRNKNMNKMTDLLTDLSMVLNQTDYYIKYNEELNEVTTNIKDSITYYDANNENDMDIFLNDLIEFLKNRYMITIKEKGNKEFAIKDINKLELR